MALAGNKELDDGLAEVGSQLASPPSDVDELISLLDKTEQFLKKIDQSPSSSKSAALQSAMKALVANFFLYHPDEDVKVSVASCVSEITRITAPDAPYDDDLMKVIFQMIVEAFKKLDNTSSRSFIKRVSILETVAKFRSCVLMLDLDCDALILEMFRHFLKTIRSNHSEGVFSSMVMIMTLVLEDSEDISLELLSCLLDSMKDNKDVLPIARKLGEQVVCSSVTKIKHYLFSYDLNDYSKLVTSISQDNSDALEHTERNVLDTLEQHTNRNVPDKIVADEIELSERTVSDKLPEMVANSPKSSRNTKTADQSYLEDSIKTPSRRKRPRGTEEISETPDHETRLDQSLVGSKIQVWWPDDKRFYNGIVDSFDPNTGDHKIVYDDGDIEILHLKNEKYKIVEDGSEASKGKDIQEEMSSSPSSSQNSEDTHVGPPPDGKKYVVSIAPDGNVGGRDCGKWSTRIGALIRTIVPISYRDWRLIPDLLKDAVWNAILIEFELNIDPCLARPLVEKSWSQFFRTAKLNYRRKYFIHGWEKRDIIANCPNDVDKVVWESFVNQEWDEKKIKIRQKNTINKAKSTISHALGRKKYARVYEELAKTNPGNEYKREVAWKKAHTRKDGSILPSAEGKYHEIEAEERRRALEASGQSSAANSQDIDHDVLASVFGKDKKSRCRAISSYSSAKQVKCSLASQAIAEDQQSSAFEEFKVIMEASVKATMEVQFKELKKVILSMPQFSQQPPPHPDCVSSRTETASNFFQNPRAVRNLSAGFDSATPPNLQPSNEGSRHQSDKQYVHILSSDQQTVAKGYISDRLICHGQTVAPDECCVWVEEVCNPKARIYEAPQFGHTLLGEVADGAFIIWLRSRVRLI